MSVHCYCRKESDDELIYAGRTLKKDFIQFAKLVVGLMIAQEKWDIIRRS